MQEKLKTKLVLFDLDGTLIDTAPDFLLSLNNILIKHGKKTLRLSDIRSIVSDGSAKLVEFGFNVSSDDKQAAVYRSELLIEYKKNLMKSSKLFTGVKELINYLVKQKNDFGFPINDVCRFHLKNGADIDDIAINANVSEVGFKRSCGVMVNYRSVSYTHLTLPTN